LSDPLKWKPYVVEMRLRWWRAYESCNARVSQGVHAENEAHAVARATDRLREWFRGVIEGAEVKEGYLA
jgi:hypothetical protein